MASNNLCRARADYIRPAPESVNVNPAILHEGLFEFDEEDIWSSNAASAMEIKKTVPTPRLSRKVGRKMDKVDRTSVTCASLPVNIPDWSKIYRDRNYIAHHHQRKETDGDHDDDTDYEEDDDQVPPHEYLARRRGASFSVHEGIGRTLKGRDLRQVRNAIWKRVGFED